MKKLSKQKNEKLKKAKSSLKVLEKAIAHEQKIINKSQKKIEKLQDKKIDVTCEIEDLLNPKRKRPLLARAW